LSIENFEYELGDRHIAFSLDESIYNRDAVFGTAYLFVDRCFLWLSQPAEGQTRVRLKAKEATTEEALHTLAGEFANELLNQMVRQQVSISTQRIREYYMGRAFYGDDTRASIDALLAELDAEELADEPLEIAVPWETSDAGGAGA
jgi:His-Xaa-Ser system protein HxsD